jgi:hypothetical protein
MMVRPASSGLDGCTVTAASERGAREIAASDGAGSVRASELQLAPPSSRVAATAMARGKRKPEFYHIASGGPICCVLLSDGQDGLPDDADAAATT